VAPRHPIPDDALQRNSLGRSAIVTGQRMSTPRAGGTVGPEAGRLAPSAPLSVISASTTTVNRILNGHRRRPMLYPERPRAMELWLVTLVAIVAMAAVGTVVARRRQPDAPRRSLASLLAARLLVIVIVTVLVAVARIEVGPVVAAATGLVGVAVAIVLLIRAGYAGSIFPAG
jgi:hypothetical protein